MQKTVIRIIAVLLVALMCLTLLPIRSWADYTYTPNTCPGHNYTVQDTTLEGALKSAATCTNSAVYYYACANCGQLSRDDEENANLTFSYGEPLGHSFTEHHNAVAATCMTAGTGAYDKCIRCDATDPAQPETIAALGHEWVDDQTITAATCTTVGSKVQKCNHEGCNETRTVEIPALGHTFVAEIRDTNANPVSAATCTSPAVYKKVCSVCGALSEETFTSGETVAHNFVAEIRDTNANPVSAATCTSPAVYKKVCSVCGALSNETFTSGSALDHEWVDDQTITAATCTTAGSMLQKCNHTGCNETRTVAIPALGGEHIWADGECSRCHEKGFQLTVTIQGPGSVSVGTTTLTSGQSITMAPTQSIGVAVTPAENYYVGSVKLGDAALTVQAGYCSLEAAANTHARLTVSFINHDPAATPVVSLPNYRDLVFEELLDNKRTELAETNNVPEYRVIYSYYDTLPVWNDRTRASLTQEEINATGGLTVTFMAPSGPTGSTYRYETYYERNGALVKVADSNTVTTTNFGHFAVFGIPTFLPLNLTVTVQGPGVATFRGVTVQRDNFITRTLDRTVEPFDITFTPDQGKVIRSISVNDTARDTSTAKVSVDPSAGGNVYVNVVFGDPNAQTTKTPGPHSVAATTDTSLMEAAGTKLNAVAIANNYSTANSAFAVYEVTPKWSDGTTMTAADVKAHPVTFTLQAPQGTSADTHFFQVWHYENGSFSKRVSNSLSVTTDSCSPFAVLAFSKAASTDPLYDPAAKPSVIASSVIDVIDDGDTQKGSVTLSTNGRQLEYVRSSSEPTSSTKWIKMTTNKLSDLAAGGRYYFRYTYISSALPESGWVYQDIGEWYTVTAQLLYGKGTYETDKPHYENYAHVYVVKKGESITFTFTPENRYWLHEINVNGRYVGQSNVQKTYVVKDITAKTLVSFGFSSYTSSPKTGDSSDLMKWGTMEIVSLLGMVSITWYLFRRKEY